MARPPQIRTGAGYFPHTEYEIGAMRVGEALHCIIGCWYDAEFDEHHVLEEISLIDCLIREYGGEHAWGNYHHTNWNKYEKEIRDESIGHMRKNSLNILGKVPQMLESIDLPDEQQKIAIAVYKMLESLAVAVIKSIDSYPNSISNAYNDPNLLLAYFKLKYTVKDWLNTKNQVRSPLWPMQRKNPVEPLPSLKNEIALMTLEEFLEFRNPGDKFHGEDSYTADLESLNRNYSLQHVENYRADGHIFSILKADEGYLIRHAEDYRDPSDLVAIIQNGILYYSNPSLLWRLPPGYREKYKGGYKEYVSFDIKEKIRVKYLQEYLPLINNVKDRNLQKYPHLQQRIKREDENYQIRFEKEPSLNKGITIVILNSKMEVVAQASNEWGATLLLVAEEYRSRSLGKLLGQLWYQWNPDFTSGGFTHAGRTNAIAIWEDRVREFRAKGWYSELLRQKSLSKTRLNDIISDLKKKRQVKTKVVGEPQRKTLIFVEKEDNYWGPTFVIYDEAFLHEEDEKYIYGFGFFRDSENIGTFLYTIDYERPFQKLTTNVALQIAKNNNEKIYVGPGYGDLLELEEISNLKQEGNYIELETDIIDLESFSRLEQITRHKYDSYNNKYYRLLEMAESKWR